MKLLNNISILIISICTAILLTACGTDHDHGPTPVGLNLLVSGEVIASQQGTTISYAGDADHIALTAGESSLVTIQFILESGEPVVYDTEEGYSLVYNVSNTDVLSISHPVQGNEWNAELSGVSAGTSTLNFELMHVGHADFESRNFEIRVTSAD